MNRDKKIYRLRCFAYFNKSDGKYYAFCVDLNLVDQGSSFEEVQNKLHENIELYLKSELKYYNENGIKGFPYRKAPWNVMIHFYYINILFHMAFITSRIVYSSYIIFKCLFDSDTDSVELCPQQ